MKTDNNTSQHYTADRGKAYFEYQNHFSFRDIGAKLNVRNFAPHVKPSDWVLDFGCGGGWLLRELVCRQKVGVELNEHAHPECRDNQVKVYKFVSEVAERDFDVIISNHCLEHVPHPIEALSALRQLLSPDGKLIFVVPIDDWRVQRDFAGTDIDHHLHTWSARLMANTLVEAGFVPLESRTLTHAWFPIWQKFYGKIPMFAFDALCWAYSVAKKRRQLLVCAKKA